AALGPSWRLCLRRCRCDWLPACCPLPGAADPAAHPGGTRPDPRAARSGGPARSGTSVRARAAPGDGSLGTGPAIRARLTDLVGIGYRMVQTGMGLVAGARLAAATARAGGLGIIGSATMTLDALRVAVATVKDRTDAPFGVNLRADAPDAAERIELMIA